MPKIEILFPTIERWHCIDLILENMRLADKPENTQVLCVLSGSDKYAKYVEDKLKTIFKKVKIIRNKDTFVEHDKLRKIQYENVYAPDLKISLEKMLKVYRTYSLIQKNADLMADYYWFIEDDTMFPLDIYEKYFDSMRIFGADIVTGQSYYWHTLDKQKRNFWKIEQVRIFPNGDECDDTEIKLVDWGICDEGAVKLGATGLGNVLCKADAVKTWNPKSYLHLNSGADISFFYNAQEKGLRAFGIWNIYLPHITKYQNGDIEIRGRLDKSIIPIVNRFYDSRRNI